MRILKTMAIAAATYLTVTSCGNDSTTTLDAEVLAGEFSQVVLYKIEPNNLKAFDTIQMVDNKFSTTLNIDTADFIYMQLSPRFGIPMFIEPGEKVSVSVANPDEMTYEISGSPESARIRQINEVLRVATERVEELNKQGRAAMEDSVNFEAMKPKLDSTYENIVATAKKEYQDMINEQPASIANIFIFSQSLGQRALITPQEDLEYFEKVGEGIKEKYPNSIHTKNYMERMEEIRKGMAKQKEMDAVKSRLAPGSEVPEIALENPQGEVMKLSDLRGKVVLVDFWAAWCRPCRMENPNLVRMYNEYKDKGFDVYSVSLDGLPQQQDPKADWIKAITTDNLTWSNHVSDLQGWNTSVIKDFGFQGIPYTVLVDREGKIIATELRGPALEAKLKEVL